MTHKNRKKKRQFPIPISLFALLILAGLGGVGYLLLHERCDQLGREIKLLEVKRDMTQHRYQNEEFRWSNLRAPRNIEAALQQHGLIMVWPGRDRIVRLYDSAVAGDQLLGDVRESTRYAEMERIVLND